MKHALYYTSLPDKKVRCELCPHFCLLPPRKRGVCLTRQNSDGTLVSLNYCRPVSTAIDPVEKKPLYHFHPGASIFSTGPNGCTLKCGFCQNCEISQTILDAREIPAEAFAARIVSSGTIGVAYTYSEPFIWFETIMDIGTRIKNAGLCNVMVTNGYMNPGPLNDLLGIVDAMNIDIKSMNPRFYSHLCKGQLGPVLRSCEEVRKRAHLEITNLLIPGENDSEGDIRCLVDFMADHLGKDTPLHLSRYFPRHAFAAPPTPHQTLLRAWEIARERLDYVYLGNVASGDKENTRCPACNDLLIERSGYRIALAQSLKSGANGNASCKSCGKEIPVIL